MLAIDFIKQNSHRHIQVTDILREVPISRLGPGEGLSEVPGPFPAKKFAACEWTTRCNCCAIRRGRCLIAAACGFERSELFGTPVRSVAN